MKPRPLAARALYLSASWRGANESVLSELNDNGEAERSAQWLTATKFHEVFPSLGKSSFCQRTSVVYCQTLTQTCIDISGHETLKLSPVLGWRERTSAETAPELGT